MPNKNSPRLRSRKFFLRIPLKRKLDSDLFLMCRKNTKEKTTGLPFLVPERTNEPNFRKNNHDLPTLHKNKFFLQKTNRFNGKA